MFKRRQIRYIAHQLAWHGVTELNDISLWLQQTRLSEGMTSVERIKQATLIYRSICVQSLKRAVNDLQSLAIRVEHDEVERQIVSFIKNKEGYFEANRKGSSELGELHEGVLDYLRFIHKGTMNRQSLLLMLKDYFILLGHIRWYDIFCEETFSQFYNEHYKYLQKPWEQEEEAFGSSEFDVEDFEDTINSDFDESERQFKSGGNK
jgi:hypothetical protein